MRISRVFIDAALHAGGEIELPRDSVDHLVKVLRLGVGARITLFNGRGGEYAATLSRLERRGATAAVLAHDPIERESPLAITLMQAVTRGEKMDWVLQKSTELGVAAIQPIEAARSVVQLDADRAEKRRAHWHGILRSACEQCGRNRLPRMLAPTNLDDACREFAREAPDALRLTLEPNAAAALDSAALAHHALSARSVAILIGPEGGWSEAELQSAASAGFTGMRLGPRVLRTETAAIAALTAIQTIAGDLARD
jgi:16S rRNA (uracil1498-N3)-methyltransferase